MCLWLEKYIFKFIYNETITKARAWPSSSIYYNWFTGIDVWNVHWWRGPSSRNYSLFIYKNYKNLFFQQKTHSFIVSFNLILMMILGSKIIKRYLKNLAWLEHSTFKPQIATASSFSRYYLLLLTRYNGQPGGLSSEFGQKMYFPIVFKNVLYVMKNHYQLWFLFCRNVSLSVFWFEGKWEAREN